MDDRQFTAAADEALADLYKRLIEATDQYELEVDFNGGVLSVEFEEPPTKFVVSPNSSVRQIWVSARSKSFKLDWNDARQSFVLNGTQTLPEMMADVIGQQIGEPVRL